MQFYDVVKITLATVLLLNICSAVAGSVDDSKVNDREKERKLNGASLKGVNLGGWLVLEPWMSWYSPATNSVPSSIPNTEFAISKYWGEQNKLQLVADHHNNFITANTLDALVWRKVDIVRIPLGWWATGSGADVSPYVPDVIYYVDWVMKECEKRKIRVILNMHAAYGSQNGFFHSSPETLSVAKFCDETDPAAQTLRDNTVARLVEWATRYKESPALWGISILNEPICSGKLLSAWYEQAYNAVRNVVKGVWIIIAPNVYADDGRQDDVESWKVWELQNWSNFAKSKTYVALDLHLLQTPWALGDDRWASMTFEDHLNEARNAMDRIKALCNAQVPLIIGEWSAAGPRYDWWKSDLAYQQFNDFKKLQEQSLPQSCVLASLFWSARVDGNPTWSFL